MKMTAQDVIQKLGLKPLPDEGGFFRETYRNGENKLTPESVGLSGSTPRSISTAIYYLIAPESFSALHRIKCDEVFHFYCGDPVDMIQIDESGGLTRSTMGPDIFKSQTPQIVVPRGVWQGLRLSDGGLGRSWVQRWRPVLNSKILSSAIVKSLFKNGRPTAQTS